MLKKKKSDPHRQPTAPSLLLTGLPHSPTRRISDSLARSKSSEGRRSYLLGAAIMMAGVVLPLAYMIFRSKRSPSSASAASAAGPSSFSKQT
nr:unnamed protein product [Digitaria exilis]